MRGRELSNETLPDLADVDLAPRSPVALYLVGTVVVMNVCATVLSLMA
ncbi:hypothetical protein [Microvirga ossetica]|nr:hypothetical protein [Microvirga ossetica]